MANHFIGFYHLVKFILWIIKLLFCMKFLSCCGFPNILTDVVFMAAELKVNSSIFEQNYDDTKCNAFYSFQPGFKMLSLFYYFFSRNSSFQIGGVAYIYVHA